MNDLLARILIECEQTHFYGVVEVHFSNGIAAHANVKKTYKLTSMDRPKGETRGASNGSYENENRKQSD
jgi:hypothetical protein